MFATSEHFREAVVTGATPAVSASAWYGGKLTARALEVAPGGYVRRSIGQYGTRSELRLPVLDPDGTLSALSLTAPLMPFGQRLSVSVTLGRETVPLGVFRIRRPGHESPLWSRRVGSTRIPSAMALTIEADDLLVELADETLTTPYTPAAGGTVATETVRVLDGVLPVGGWPAPAAMSVPAGSTWESSRLAALAGILGAADMWPDMDRSGAVRPLPRAARTAVDWDLPEDLVSGGVQPTVDASTITNGVVLRGEGADGKPLMGASFTTQGPLRWGGPLGRRPLVESNPIMRTQAAIDAAAATRLAGLEARRSVTIVVRAPANPTLDLMDVVRLPLHDRPLVGTVVEYTLPLSGGQMDITLSVPWRQVWI